MIIRLVVAFICGMATAADPPAPPITALAIAPGGDAVVVGSQDGLEVRSWPELAMVRTLTTDMDHVHDLAFSPEGNQLAVAGGNPAEAGMIELFAWPSGDRLHQGEPHGDSILAIAWRPDSSALASASLDRSVGILSPDGELETILEGHSGGVVALCVLPDGRTLVSGGLDQSVRVWDLTTGELLRQLDNHTGAIRGLALRPAETEGGPPMIASIGADRTLRFWQPTIGRMVRLARLPSEPLSLAWLPGGRAIAVACIDGRIRLIDPDTLDVLADVPGQVGRPWCLNATEDGGLVVGGQHGLLSNIDVKEFAPSER